jgi:hypothetical protein
MAIYIDYLARKPRTGVSWQRMHASRFSPRLPCCAASSTRGVVMSPCCLLQHSARFFPAIRLPRSENAKGSGCLSTEGQQQLGGEVVGGAEGVHQPLCLVASSTLERWPARGAAVAGMPTSRRMCSRFGCLPPALYSNSSEISFLCSLILLHRNPLCRTCRSNPRATVASGKAAVLAAHTLVVLHSQTATLLAM